MKKHTTKRQPKPFLPIKRSLRDVARPPKKQINLNMRVQRNHNGRRI